MLVFGMFMIYEMFYGYGMYYGGLGSGVSILMGLVL